MVNIFLWAFSQGKKSAIWKFPVAPNAVYIEIILSAHVTLTAACRFDNLFVFVNAT